MYSGELALHRQCVHDLSELHLFCDYLGAGRDSGNGDLGGVGGGVLGGVLFGEASARSADAKILFQR